MGTVPGVCDCFVEYQMYCKAASKSKKHFSEDVHQSYRLGGQNIARM